MLTIYSKYDISVIRKGTSMKMPLIGGTAIELLAEKFKFECYRTRSNNDVDFITNSEKDFIRFSKWCKQNTEPKKIMVDVMLVKSHIIPKELILNINNILVMAPEYLLWSKLCRGLARDMKDINWLLNICDIDKLEYWLSELGVTKNEINNINNLILKKL